MWPDTILARCVFFYHVFAIKIGKRASNFTRNVRSWYLLQDWIENMWCTDLLSYYRVLTGHCYLASARHKLVQKKAPARMQ